MNAREGQFARWLNPIVLLGFGWAAILLELAPLGGMASATPSPDLLFCVAAYLVLRRPSTTPVLIVIFLGIARDIVGGGAVGLGALTLLGAVEALRAYREWLQRRSFVHELVAIAVLAIAIDLIHVVILTITLAPSPALEILALGQLATLGAYIGVAGVFRFALRLTSEPLEARNMIRGTVRNAR